MTAEIERWWSGQRDRECVGKVRHPTEAEAVRAARILELQTHREFSVYRCRFCKRWHVGSGSGLTGP